LHDYDLDDDIVLVLFTQIEHFIVGEGNEVEVITLGEITLLQI